MKKSFWKYSPCESDPVSVTLSGNEWKKTLKQFSIWKFSNAWRPMWLLHTHDWDFLTTNEDCLTSSNRVSFFNYHHYVSPYALYAVFAWCKNSFEWLLGGPRVAGSTMVKAPIVSVPASSIPGSNRASLIASVMGLKFRFSIPIFKRKYFLLTRSSLST